MNRDTHADVLDRTSQGIHAAFDMKKNVKTCGQLRQAQDRHKESMIHAAISEKNKEVTRLAPGDVSLLVSLREFPDGHGRTVDNHSSVSRSAPSTMNPRSPFLNGDLRRNLYVLGLPFDLTKAEFSKIFEPYGTVTHAVILATLDSASRRRGFIVMSTNQEAKLAMETLSRTQIKGHMLDVSWAVVQRSQGFLDGADRTMMLAVSTPSSISEPDGLCPIPALGNSAGSEDQINDHWELSHLPTSKLLVSNLSTILFTQVSDLHPLFYPFGPIKAIKILGSSSVGAMGTTITAMVEYVNVSSAQEAKDALQFQSYAGHPIEAHYVCDASPSMHTRSSTFLAGSLLGHGKIADIGLNPFAIPFNIGSRFSTGNQIYNSRYSVAIPSGLPGDAPLAPQPFPAHMRPYMTDAISRSSSATSSSWSNDGRPLRPSRTPSSSFIRVDTYPSYA